MRIKNATKKIILADSVSVADNFISRFIGLMGKKEFPEGNCLVITPCKSIHMFFMKFPIDVLFIDKDQKVTYIIENMKPWSFSRIVWNSYNVIELPAGTVSKTGTKTGDLLKKIG